LELNLIKKELFSYENEKYEEHIDMAIKELECIKDRILPTLNRLYENKISSIIKFLYLIIIYHDAGKLTKDYQDYLKEIDEKKLGYDHEVLSTLIAYEPFSELFPDFRYEGLAAILTHHEAMRLSRTNNFRADYIISKLRRKFGKEIKILEDGAILLNELVKKYVNRQIETPNKILIEEAKTTLTNILSHFLTAKGEEAWKRANRTTALQHILCLVDNRAASRIRGNEDSLFLKAIIGDGLLE